MASISFAQASRRVNSFFPFSVMNTSTKRRSVSAVTFLTRPFVTKRSTKRLVSPKNTKNIKLLGGNILPIKDHFHLIAQPTVCKQQIDRHLLKIISESCLLNILLNAHGTKLMFKHQAAEANRRTQVHRLITPNFCTLRTVCTDINMLTSL